MAYASKTGGMITEQTTGSPLSTAPIETYSSWEDARGRKRLNFFWNVGSISGGGTTDYGKAKIEVQHCPVNDGTIEPLTLTLYEDSVEQGTALAFTTIDSSTSTPIQYFRTAPACSGYFRIKRSLWGSTPTANYSYHWHISD